MKAALVAMVMADGHLDFVRKRDVNDYENKGKRLKYVPKGKIYETISGRIRFYKADASLRKFFKESLIEVGEYCDYGTKATKVVCCQNKKIFNWFVEFGEVPVGKKSSILRIPDWILSSESAMNGFLSAYFACDGSFYDNTIDISSCSRKLIYQMADWLQARGVLCRVYERNFGNKRSAIFRLVIKHENSVKRFINHIRMISDIKKAVYRVRRDLISNSLKYSDGVIKKWISLRNRGYSYGRIANLYLTNASTVHRAIKNFLAAVRGKCRLRKQSYEQNALIVRSISFDCYAEVFDLEVMSGRPQYIVNGLVSHNSQGSGKSWASITCCAILDPNFSVDRIFFSYDDLVYARKSLKPHTAVLVDEQSESYGVDSHRVNIILSALKEQLRKKSIHFFFCSPTLKPEYQSSQYVLETLFIDYEEKVTYCAYKTRELLTLGYVRIPHPLNYVSKEFLKAYEDKKDAHLDRLTGVKQVDEIEDRAKMIINTPLFKKAELIYVKRIGYVPMGMLFQVINKLYPEFRSSVIVGELATRIKLNKELSGEWIVSGAKRKKQE